MIAHDAKSLQTVPQTLAHDTEVAAYLLEPARRAYPFRELTEERGFGTDIEDPAAADAVLLRALADWQREEIRARGLTDLLTDVELPLVRILRQMELAGLRLDTRRLAAISDRVKAEADALEREIFEIVGEEFTLGSPSSWGRSCSAGSACRANAGARPDTRPTPACCRRSVTNIR